MEINFSFNEPNEKFVPFICIQFKLVFFHTISDKRLSILVFDFQNVYSFVTAKLRIFTRLWDIRSSIKS